MSKVRKEIVLPEHIMQYVNDFRDYLSHDRRLAGPTIHGYCYCTMRFLEFVNCDPSLVASKDIRDLFKHLGLRKMRSASIAGYICALRSFYNWMHYAHKSEPVADMAFYLNKIVRSKSDNEVTQVPSDSEVDRLRECMLAYKKAFSFNLDAIECKFLLRDLAIVEIFKATGCRSGELKHVCLSDIDLEERTMLIRKPKGGKQRVSIFGDSAKEAIMDFAKGWEIQPEETMFSFTKYNIFNELVRRWAERAGINPNIHPHSLRHYHVTKAQRDGVSAQMVANQVGHVNLTTTLRYTHLDHVHRRKEYQATELQK